MKRYLISSFISFLTGFSLVLFTQIDNITLESFKDGSYIGIIFTATRMGIKGVIEYFLVSRGVKSGEISSLRI